ncbi:MAG TPA: DMT family transporter [Roseiflexaceae bacterium]|nr:DMT family transporter [Roseiflexaceae bacterium]
MWALYALTAALLTSFLPIINKRILTTADVAVVAWIPNALSLPLLLVVTLALIGWSSIDGLFLLAVLASGILNLVATLASTRALQLADASVATPFLSFNPAFTLLLSIFTLREIPSVRGIVGVLLIVLGAYLFQVKEVGKGMLAPVQALVRQPGVLLAIGASFVWGLTPIAEKIAIQHTIPENPLMVAFVTTILTVVLLTPALWRSAGDLLEQVRRQRHLFGTAGLISGVAPLFGFSAIALGYVGYVTALFKLGAIFTVVWGALLLKEHGLRERLLATIVMAFGGLLIAL